MRLTFALSALASATCTLLPTTAARADWVSLPASGGPITACNPKTGTPPTQTQSATLATCKVTGLPPAILPGYFLKAAADGSNITINGIVVGLRYDRVYCKAVGTTTNCDFTAPVVIATRVKMSNTASARNAACPVWAPTPNNDCFETNKVFRSIRGSNPVYNGSGTVTTPAVEIATDIAYFMGTVDGGSSPDTALAKKYLEYVGKTSTNQLFGTLAGQLPAPGSANYLNNPVSPGDRDATKIVFQSDTNAADPDQNPPYSYTSQWSPWLFVRQVCSSFSLSVSPTFKTRLFEAGEEGQVSQSISSVGYFCAP